MERDLKPPKIRTEKDQAVIDAEKDARRDAIAKTMTKANKALIRDGRTTGGEIHLGWKAVDCFFLYEKNPGNRVLHIRLNPVEDDQGSLSVTMRELDRAIMLEERQRTSIGDEHQAVVRIVRGPTLIPNTPASIARLLRQELPLPK